MDNLSRDKRSWNMSRIRGENTKPEITVRSLLHRMGYRFRLHVKKLPGRPDIVLSKYNTVVFVHGCFWHRHPDCKRASTPSIHRAYWLPKFQRTVERDKENKRMLLKLGWRVIVVWECETKKEGKITKRLIKRLMNLQATGINS